MRKLLLSAVLCLLTSTAIQADPFVILPSGELAFTTSFNTQGSFTCALCTGSGTNSVVFGSGANTVTLTFTGVNTTTLVGAQAVPTLMGQIAIVTTGSGSIFPVGSNPLIFFNLTVTQSSPTAGTAGLDFGAFGGGSSLTFNTLVTDHLQFPTGPNPPPFTYTFIVYSFLPFTVPNSNALVNVNANLSAVPEPTSLLLLGSGVGVMLTLLAKRFSRSDSTD